MDKLDLISTNERTIIDFSKWGIDGIAVIGHYKYYKVHPQLPRHNHSNMIEIVYCARGEQIYEVNEQVYSIKGGDIFLTMPDELHSTAGYPEDKGELYWILLDMATEKILSWEKKEAGALKQTLLNIPNRHFSGSPSMKKNLETLISFHKYESLNLLQQIQVKYIVEGILLELLELGFKETATINNATLKKIKEFIEQNIKSNFTIQQLAAHVYLSESRFKAWFKEKTGIPPLEYVLRRKINYAKELLLKGDKSVQDIAYELYFSSAQYFAKVFKKYTNLNPTEIREAKK